MWMLEKWGRFSDSLKLFCQTLLIHTGEKNGHNGSRDFDIDKATLNPGLWRKVMVEEISASLLSWWMSVDGEVPSFSVLCLKNNDYQYPSCPGLQLLLWFKLKGLGVFFIWILITMWVELTKKEKKKIDTRRGVTLQRWFLTEWDHPVLQNRKGVSLDRVLVSAEFCWIDTRKLLHLAEVEANPPPPPQEFHGDTCPNLDLIRSSAHQAPFSLFFGWGGHFCFSLDRTVETEESRTQT